MNGLLETKGTCFKLVPLAVSKMLDGYLRKVRIDKVNRIVISRVDGRIQKILDFPEGPLPGVLVLGDAESRPLMDASDKSGSRR